MLISCAHWINKKLTMTFDTNWSYKAMGFHPVNMSYVITAPKEKISEESLCTCNISVIFSCLNKHIHNQNNI